jgi:hypothetical protein
LRLCGDAIGRKRGQNYFPLQWREPTAAIRRGE